MSPNNQGFDRNVFINCPFDSDYKQLLRVLIFTVIECGFEPRIASERVGSDEVRIDKIRELIKESRYSIHDISRMEPLENGDLPRFNMPFELGLDLGCREFGGNQLSQKKCLILEKERYRYQEVISDISGNDIKSHDNQPQKLVRQVRSWIRALPTPGIPSGDRIWQRFNEFYASFIASCEELGFSEEDIEEMPTVEYIDFIRGWRETLVE